MKQRIAFQVVLLCLGLSALAGTAAATSVTTTTGGAAATPTIHLVPDAGHSTIANPIATIECSSTVQATVASHGTGVTAKGNISILEFTGCTNSWHVTAENKGKPGNPLGERPQRYPHISTVRWSTRHASVSHASTKPTTPRSAQSPVVTRRH